MKPLINPFSGVVGSSIAAVLLACSLVATAAVAAPAPAKPAVATPAPLPAALASTTAVPAVDLLQCYQKALQNDSQWKTALSTYKADREAKSVGRSRLLPTITGRVRAAENKYKSNSPQITQKDGGGNITNCLQPGELTLGCIATELSGLEITDEIDSEFASEDYQLTLTQPLFQMESWNEYQAGKAMAHKAKADLKVAHQAMIVRIGEGYFKALKTQDDERFVEREGEAIEQQARLSRRAYEQGVASETEYLETQVAVDSFMAEREAARGFAISERNNLAALVGEHVPRLAALSEDVPIEMPRPATADEWILQARAHSAKLLATEYAVSMAEYDHEKARAGHYPKAQLIANYLKTDMHGGQAFTPASEMATIGVELQVPIYSGGFVSATRRQKLYAADKARDSSLSQRILVETTVSNLYTLVTAEMRRVGYRKRAVVTSNNALRATRKSYDDGTRTILDLLQAQNHYYREQSELAHSRYEYLINTLKLKEAAGNLSEEDLKSLNAWLIK